MPKQEHNLTNTPEEVLLLEGYKGQNDMTKSQMLGAIDSYNNTITQIQQQIVQANDTIVKMDNQNSMLDDIISQISPMIIELNKANSSLKEFVPMILPIIKFFPELKRKNISLNDIITKALS